MGTMRSCGINRTVPTDCKNNGSVSVLIPMQTTQVRRKCISIISYNASHTDELLGFRLLYLTTSDYYKDVKTHSF